MYTLPLQVCYGSMFESYELRVKSIKTYSETSEL